MVIPSLRIRTKPTLATQIEKTIVQKRLLSICKAKPYKMIALKSLLFLDFRVMNFQGTNWSLIEYS